ncbi:MAG: hypothetical protein LBT89_09300, partial [Planctomycetaceae bacterium]|nr:hypothetical protein [Planctomycetaceae bacterium]
MFNTLFGHREMSNYHRQRRTFRLEELERRELLSVTPYADPDAINVGVVYHEDYVSDSNDAEGDTFIVSWNGGVAGTTLNQIVIQLGKDPLFPNSASIHFNENGTIPNQDGTFYPFTYSSLLQNEGNGITVTSYSVSEDGKTLTINFDGFTSGKKFYFKIDVDEIQGESVPAVDRLVSGAEMEGAIVTGKFSVADYAEQEFSLKMVNAYSGEKAELAGVPLDDYGSEIGAKDHDNTAGAVGTLASQTPLKGSLSGYVYHDLNNNGIKEDDEAGIAGVQLELFYYDTETGYYKTTGRFAVTDENGSYLFDDIAGNVVYKIVEAQPEGFLDGKDSAGKINGEQDTAAVHYEPDILADIHLGANAVGTDYNFGEYKGATVSGNVYEDKNNNGVQDEGEDGIENVTIYLCEILPDGTQQNIASTVTDKNGKYSFDNLDPSKKYCLTEVDPEGYCDGINAIGTVNGKTVGGFREDNNDAMTGIVLGSGEDGIEYNFAENRKGSLSGFVYIDGNENGSKDGDEVGIKDVKLTLWVWDEELQTYIQTTKTAVTNEYGFYSFEGLCPFKKYQVREEQPEDYADGSETVGTIDGDLVGNLPESDDDTIGNILLPPNGQGE